MRSMRRGRNDFKRYPGRAYGDVAVGFYGVITAKNRAASAVIEIRIPYEWGKHSYSAPRIKEDDFTCPPDDSSVCGLGTIGFLSCTGYIR